MTTSPPCPCGCEKTVAECITGTSPEAIIAACAEAWGQFVWQVVGDCSMPNAVRARHLAIAVLREVSEPTMTHLACAAAVGQTKDSARYAINSVLRSRGRQWALYEQLCARFRPAAHSELPIH